MEKVVSISVKGMIVTKLQNALAGVTLWLYFPCPVPAVCPLVNTPGRQGDVTRPGRRWYHLPLAL